MNNKLKLPRSIIGLALLTTLTLVGCGKKGDEPTASTSESPAATSSSSAEPAATTTTNDSTIPAAAQKLGVKPQGETCPSSAPVKGKVTKKRGNIYRVAKSPDYSKVKPDICFKDTATAEKAGFKAPS